MIYETLGINVLYSNGDVVCMEFETIDEAKTAFAKLRLMGSKVAVACLVDENDGEVDAIDNTGDTR